MKLSKVALLLGGNLGNREENLKSAIVFIESQAGTLIKRSSIYKTAAWGIENQEDFLNQALLLETALVPHELLNVLLNIEKELGRIRDQKWGPRIIDIDILYIDDLVINDDDLKIPHPYLHERKFSLVPLEELSPDWIHPIFKKNISTLIAECKDQGKVAIY